MKEKSLRIERSIQASVMQDITRKIVLLSGPRQTGKTTLARNLDPSFEYLNYDFAEHRSILQKMSWDRQKRLVVFDELHKKKNWKRWLKGVFDVEGIKPGILVTGSARLEVARKVGDSLAGRFFHYRLYPFDLKETAGHQSIDKAYSTLKTVGGFPEPFLEGSPEFYEKWRRSHLDIILRQDLIETETIRDLTSIQLLIELLKDRVGSTLSYASLARDLEKDAKTVKRWVQILENLYIVFLITPFQRNLQRSIRKEPKVYFYDLGLLRDRPAAQLENLVALSLLKELHRLADVEGKPGNLHYLRTKDGREIDFYIQTERNPPLLIEVKTSDAEPSTQFKYFQQHLKNSRGLQLVESIKRDATYPNHVEVRSLPHWLQTMNLTQSK